MTQKEKVLVTGGAGFIGSHVADLLLENGYEVVILDDLSGGKRGNINKKARFYQIDIHDPELKNIFEKEKPEYICHQAAQISVSYSVKNPEADAHTNTMGLLHLLECARDYQPRGIVFASSGGTVYGKPDLFPVSEKFPLAPASPYGIAKMCSEYYLNFYCQEYGLNYISLRYGNVYGPRQDPHGEAGVVAIFIAKMLKGETPVIYGDGKCVRDYVYVKDVANACLRSMKNMLKLSRLCEGEGSCFNYPFRAFNIGTGKETSVNRLYAYLQGMIGFPLPANYSSPRPGDLRKNVLDPRLAKEYLDWEAENEIKEGLKKTVEWFRLSMPAKPIKQSS